MYSVYEINGRWWVGYYDEAEGAEYSIPYHSKASSYEDREDDSDYEDMDTGHFNTWIYEYSNKDRKETNRVFNITENDISPKQPFNFVAYLKATPTVQSCTVNIPPISTTKETEMNTTDTVEATQRKYLNRRSLNIFYQKDSELGTHHGLNDDPAPVNGEDLIERIKEGKFTLLSKEARRYCNTALDHFRWRHPDRKEDRDGYSTSYAKLKAMFTKTEDAIMIATPQDALKAVEKFEKETFH